MSSVAFKGSRKPTIGVEVEVQLVDREMFDLVPASPQILQKLKTKAEKEHIKSELTQAMVEINTDISRTVAEVGDGLRAKFDLLRQLAAGQNLEILVAGTHPFQQWREQKVFPSDRYQAIVDKFQWLARRLTIFGLHVHIGIPTGDRAIAVINALINYIPHLLALSASSPFWSATDTGMESCRVAVFESMPTGGLPYFFVDWKEFQRYHKALQETGAIHSIKDIYWDIRPHYDFGTIEVRICDGIPTLQETLGLVALIQCLVVWIDSQYRKGKRSRQIHMQHYWVAPENKWQAARYGLDGNIILAEGKKRKYLREDIADLLETLRPVAKELQCERELAYVEEILKNGPSSTRQRRIYKETGSLTKVVQSLVGELKVVIPAPCLPAGRKAGI
ncbi:MAG: glutamate--cysteine ligase [Deltaproteobacteria bacterium]|nr:glutamate--cysteine ligase [Deltaproteobacteria bacterium]